MSKDAKKATNISEQVMPYNQFEKLDDYDFNERNKSYLNYLIVTICILICICISGTYIIQKTISYDKRDNRAAELTGIITHLDEILTMSVKMSSITGDSEWEERYNYYEPQLEKAISEAKNLIPSKILNDTIININNPNEKVAEIEKESFKLINEGKLNEAQALLNSTEYQKEKELYRNGISEFTNFLSDHNHNAHIKYHTISFVLIGVIIICICLLFILYFYIAQKNKYSKELQDIARFPSEDPNPILRITKSGRVLYSNEAGTKLVERWLTNVDNEKTNKHQSKIIQACNSGDTIEYEENIDDKVLSITIIPIEGTNYANLYARDITEQKQTHERLIQANENFKKILANSPFGVVIVGRDRKIIWANEYTCKLAKIENPDEIIGCNCGEYLCPAQQNECPIIDKCQSVDNSERIFQRCDGHQIPIIKTIAEIELNGQQVLLETFIDITELKEAEKSLQKSRNFLQTVIDAIPDSLTVIDLNHKVCLANKAVRILAQERDPIRNNLCCYQISHHRNSPCRGQDDQCPVQEVITQRECIVMEHTHFDTQGNEIFVEVTAAPVFDEYGEVTHIIEASKDITERKKSEKIIKQAQIEAEEANKAKSKFLANMSHEIRTPMNSIIGFSNLLSETELKENQKEYVNSVLSSGKHLLNLINDILDLSKIDAEKISIEIIDTPLIEILKPIESMLLPLAIEKNIEFTIKTNGRVPSYIKTDSFRLKQCLVNIANNAIKFTEYGHVHLIVSSEIINGEPFIRFEIEDTGIGISEEKQSIIFDSFTQANDDTTRTFGGTGLGLTITKHLVELLGGEIHVNSKPGLGSTFSVLIPTLIDIENQPPLNLNTIVKGKSESFEAIKFTGNILVADDVKLNQKLIQLLLEKHGLKVEIANDGQHATELAFKENFDLIFMDIQMPVMDGYEATKLLREKGIEIPIVALTASALQGDNKKCFNAGCNDYLTKPIDKPKLIQILSKYLPVANDIIETSYEEAFCDLSEMT